MAQDQEESKKKKGRGWHGDSAGHARAGKKGGQRTSEEWGSDFYARIGGEGGRKSSGKFQKDSPRAKEAGRKGGLARGKKEDR